MISYDHFLSTKHISFHFMIEISNESSILLVRQCVTMVISARLFDDAFKCNSNDFHLGELDETQKRTETLRWQKDVDFCAT